jgi:hypothetical protein
MLPKKAEGPIPALQVRLPWRALRLEQADSEGLEGRAAEGPPAERVPLRTQDRQQKERREVRQAEILEQFSPVP